MSDVARDADDATSRAESYDPRKRSQPGREFACQKLHHVDCERTQVLVGFALIPIWLWTAVHCGGKAEVREIK